MRLSFCTLALLAMAGDVGALNTLTAWEKKERPGKTAGRIQVYIQDNSYVILDNFQRPLLTTVEEELWDTI